MVLKTENEIEYEIENRLKKKNIKTKNPDLEIVYDITSVITQKTVDLFTTPLQEPNLRFLMQNTTKSFGSHI